MLTIGVAFLTVAEAHISRQMGWGQRGYELPELAIQRHVEVRAKASALPRKGDIGGPRMTQLQPVLGT